MGKKLDWNTAIIHRDLTTGRATGSTQRRML